MNFFFFRQQTQLGRGRSRSASHPGGIPSIIDLRGKLQPLLQSACSLPQPIIRALRLVALVLFFFILWLNLPSKRPYTSDLVLSTTDLKDIVATKLVPPGNEHGLPVNDTSRIAHPSPQHIMNCNVDRSKLLEIRDMYGLGDQLEYLKRYVRFTRKPIERPSYTPLQQTFLPASDVDEGFQVLDLSSNYENEEKCREPLEIAVPESPFPAEVDLSDFMFAISTTFKRLSHPTTIKEWAYWLTDSSGRSNGGKLLLRLLDASDSELIDVAQRLADAGIDAEVSGWDSRREKVMAVSYLNLVPMLFTHKDSSNRKWVVLCDDDTFFTAINGVVTRLKQYDHTKPLYIGTLSEDIIAVKTHGSQAFGGGGVFLSRPLAEIITSVHETCKTHSKVKQSNSGWGPQGDILLRNCIYENTNVRLIQLRGLWQFDLRGDASGFYEGGLKPYSIHHFKGGKKWHTTYPLNATKIAHTCGEDCPYQRFVTADNFVISNGYSIAQYPDGIDFDLDQVERTFRSLLGDKGWNYDYTYGPQRPSLHKTGKKIAWELHDSQKLDDGSVSQVYVRKKDDERWTTKEGKPMRSLDGVIELIWIPA